MKELESPLSAVCTRAVCLAAACMNGWFVRCIATLEFEQLQHMLCGERVQRENRTHRLGSFLPLAALWSKVRIYPLLAHSTITPPIPFPGAPA